MKSNMTPYEVLQAASNFKVGDTVKVVRKWESGEMGYEVGMGVVEIGTQGKISEIHEFGFNLDSGVVVPFFAVEKVKLPKAPRVKKPSKGDMEDAYRKLQKQCGIKVGDYVKVLRTAKDYEMGWPTVWECQMDTTVGHVYKVHTVDQYGILFESEASCRFYYPFFVLEKVEKPFENVEVRNGGGNLIATIYEHMVHTETTILLHDEVQKIAREVAKVTKR